MTFNIPDNFDEIISALKQGGFIDLFTYMYGPDSAIISAVNSNQQYDLSPLLANQDYIIDLTHQDNIPVPDGLMQTLNDSTQSGMIERSGPAPTTATIDFAQGVNYATIAAWQQAQANQNSNGGGSGSPVDTALKADYTMYAIIGVGVVVTGLILYAIFKK